MARQGIGMARQGHTTGKEVVVQEVVGRGTSFPKWDGVYRLVSGIPPPPFWL
jgi:hypothetical protein